jgi:hypothetical protein
MKRDTSYADKRIAEVLARPLPKHLEGAFDPYQINPPRSDVAISLETSKAVNPLHQLKGQEVTFGGVGGRAGRTMGPGLVMVLDPVSLGKAATNLNIPVSEARQAMVEGRLKAIRSLGETELRGVANFITISPEFRMRMVEEGPFGKVERHRRKALKSFNRASKAMVEEFLGDQKANRHE